MVTTERLPPRTIWADVKRSRRPAPNALSRPDGPRSTAPCTRTVSSSSTVSAGLRDRRTATAPVTWGVAMEVPPKTMYPPGTEERMLSPGALTSGLTDPSQGEDPWPLKKAMSSRRSVAPTAKDSAYVPGLRTLPGSGPSLPAANAGKIPAARKAWTSGRNSAMQPALEKPQELFTTSGALAGSPPGARNHWKISWKADVKPKPRLFQALAAIH